MKQTNNNNNSKSVCSSSSNMTSFMDNRFTSSSPQDYKPNQSFNLIQKSQVHYFVGVMYVLDTNERRFDVGSESESGALKDYEKGSFILR